MNIQPRKGGDAQYKGEGKVKLELALQQALSGPWLLQQPSAVGRFLSRQATCQVNAETGSFIGLQLGIRSTAINLAASSSSRFLGAHRGRSGRPCRMSAGHWLQRRVLADLPATAWCYMGALRSCRARREGVCRYLLRQARVVESSAGPKCGFRHR